MFVVVGLVGAVLLLVFLLLDDVLDGILPDADWISGPAIGAFLAAFGLFGWVAQEGFDAPTAVAAGIGVTGGLGLGLLHVPAVQGAVQQPDRCHADHRFARRPAGQGRHAGPCQRDGEVLVRLGGQPVKLSATATEDLPRGTDSVVVAVESSTRVVVEAAETFWALDP